MKRFLFSVSAVLMATLLSAAPRSLSDAQTAANKFLTSDANRAMRMAGKDARLKLAHTAFQADQQPAFYVFNNGNNNGYVIVSADDNAQEILGYSETGSFDEANMPSNMKVWFQHYAEEIAWAAKNGKKASNIKRATTPVSPLLTTKWNQDAPYNNDCPHDATDKDIEHAYTGCVATAAAQIMRYHKHPLQGTGSHKYSWDNSGEYGNYKGKGSGTEDVDFSKATYDWDNMLDSYKGSYNETQAKAVSQLMYHVGVSCNMTYGAETVNGSGALTADMAKALYTYFKYDKSLQYIMMDFIGYKKFEQLFLAELAAQRPILMGGQSSTGGHEFVCDGVDANGYFHINWGWGGKSDDYFALSALDPEQQGAGGSQSKDGFSIAVEAVIGIQPDKGGSLKAPIITVEPDYETGKYDYKFSKTEASKTETITFTTSLAYNNGPADVKNAQVGFAVYKEDSTFVKAYSSSTFSMTAGGNNYSSLTVKGAFNGLEAGKYLLALAFRMSDTDEWTNIGVYGVGVFFEFEATTDKVIIGEIIQPAGGGGSSVVEGNLDVDVAVFWYNGSKNWDLVLTSSSSEPFLMVSFNSKSGTTVSGNYSVGTNAALYESYEDYYYSYYGMADPVTTSQSGTLNIVRRGDDEYEIWLTFKGKNGKDYEVHGIFSGVYAEDENENDINLTDPIEVPSAIENITTDQPTVIKTFQNGQIVIKLGDKTYNVMGTQIQ